MKSPGRRFAETVAAVAVAWVATGAVLSWIRDRPFRLLPSDGLVGLLPVGAILFAVTMRFLVDSQRSRKSND